MPLSRISFAGQVARIDSTVSPVFASLPFLVHRVLMNVRAAVADGPIDHGACGLVENVGWIATMPISL